MSTLGSDPRQIVESRNNKVVTAYLDVVCFQSVLEL